MDDAFYPEAEEDYASIRAKIAEFVRLEDRYPAWPFRAPSGHADFCEYSDAIEGDFDFVLQALTAHYGDTSVNLAVLEPSPQLYYCTHFGRYPAFTLATHELPRYWEAVSFEPTGDPTGAVIFTADVVAISGDTGRWAVWEERQWNLSIVLSDEPNGLWTRGPVTFSEIEDALSWYIEPPYKIPLDPAERSQFLRNVSAFGRQPRRGT